MPTPRELSVEFTAAQTIAVITRADGGTEPLSLDGSRQLPAPPPGDAGALFGRILVAATAALGERPRAVTLIHPDDWDPARVRELVDAAGPAGLPSPTVLPRRADAPVSVAAARSGRGVLIAVVAAVAALILGLGVGTAMGFALDPEPEPPKADEAESGVAAMKDAKAAAVALYSYGHEELDEAIAAAQPYMTASFAKKHNQEMEDIRSGITEKHVTVRAEVTGGGVADVKAESVEVLVLVDRKVTGDDIKYDRTEKNRLTMTMVPGRDGWKVDDVKAI